MLQNWQRGQTRHTVLLKAKNVCFRGPSHVRLPKTRFSHFHFYMLTQAPYCDRKTYSDSSNGDEQDLVTQTIRLYYFMPLSNTSVELLPAASLCLSMDLAVDQCIYMPVSLSIFLSIYLSLCLSICLSVYPLLQFSLCESEMTERSHCWTERPMLVYLSIYLSYLIFSYLI